MITIGTCIKDTRTNHKFIIDNIIKPKTTNIPVYLYKQDNKVRLLNDKHFEDGFFVITN